MAGTLAVEARYVGTLGRDIWRGIDLNQMQLEGAFLQDFRAGAPERVPRARTRAASSTRPSTPRVPGSQPLTVIPALRRRVADQRDRRAATSRPDRSAASPTSTSPSAGHSPRPARAMFLPEPRHLRRRPDPERRVDRLSRAADRARRRFASGVFWQANYTFSNAMSDSQGTTQARFEPFLDNARPELERTRTEFHVTHVLNANVDLGAALRPRPPLPRSRRPPRTPWSAAGS